MHHLVGDVDKHTSDFVEPPKCSAPHSKHVLRSLEKRYTYIFIAKLENPIRIELINESRGNLIALGCTVSKCEEFLWPLPIYVAQR